MQIKPRFDEFGVEVSEQAAVRKFFGQYSKLQKKKGDVGKVERLISQTKNILPKAHADACILLGIKKDEKLTNPNRIYGGMRFSELVEALEKFIDFSPKIGIVFRPVSSEAKPEETAAKPVKNYLTEPAYFVSAAFSRKTQGKTKYLGIFTFHAGPELRLTLELRSRIDTNRHKQFEGTFERHGGLLYLRFMEASKQLIYIFHLGNIQYDQIKYFHGTYAADSYGVPVAGEVFMERAASKEEANEKLDTVVPDIVAYLLRNKQFKVDLGAFSDIAEISGGQQFLSIQQYVGSYIGHYLSVQKRGLICECILEIHPDGFAKLFRYGDPTGLEGIVYVENNELFVLSNMNPNTTRYRSALTLNHRVEGENQRFSGNFSNMQDDYMPNAGRIIFQRIESDRIPKQEKYHVNTPADLDLFQEIHGDYALQVIDFLRGLGGDAYSDDPFQVFKNSPFDLAGVPGNKPPVVNAHASSPSPSVSVRPDWNGLYEAYIVQTFNRQGEQTPHMLQRLSVNINTHHAVFRSKRNEFHARYLPANPHFLLAELKMDGASIPEIFVCLHPDQLSEQPNSRFVGTYSGIGQTGIQHPNAGRVLLLRSNTVVEPDDFPLDLSNERLQKLMNDRPGIMDFFLGLDDYMVEGYRLFREERVLPVSMPGARKVARDMSGVYLRYRLDSDGKSIDVQPMSIMPDGQVRMLSMFGNYQYAGLLNEMSGDIIAVNFHAIQYPDGKYEDFYAQSLLYKHKLKEQAKYYKGLHLSRILDNPGKSFTCRTVMVRIAESTTDLASYTNQVKSIAIPVFGEHKDLAEFNQINAEHHNILLNLMGEDDNLMTNFAEGASGLKLSFNKSIDFGLHYFLAAAYYAESADPNKFNKAKTAWKQAIKHGFRDKLLLQEYKNSGRLPGFEHLFKEEDMLP